MLSCTEKSHTSDLHEGDSRICSALIRIAFAPHSEKSLDRRSSRCCVNNSGMEAPRASQKSSEGSHLQSEDEGKSHSSTQLLRSSEKDEIFDEWSMEREGPGHSMPKAPPFNPFVQDRLSRSVKDHAHSSEKSVGVPIWPPWSEEASAASTISRVSAEGG